MRENRGEREREEEERQKEWEDWEKGSARLAVGTAVWQDPHDPPLFPSRSSSRHQPLLPLSSDAALTEEDTDSG